MSPIAQPTIIPQAPTINLQGAANIEITNLPLALANNEYSHVMQADVKTLRIRCRESADLKYSFVSGDSGTKYWTIYKGTVENLTDITFNASTLYIQSTKASVTIEITELY